MSVVSFADGEPIIPQEEVVVMLRELLSRAEAGQVVALSYACVRPDGTNGTGYNEGLHAMNLIAATSILAHRIVADFVA